MLVGIPAVHWWLFGLNRYWERVVGGVRVIGPGGSGACRGEGAGLRYRYNVSHEHRLSARQAGCGTI